MFKMKNMLMMILVVVIAMPVSALEERERKQVREQIRSVKVWQLTRDLELSEKQAYEFFPILEQYDRRGQQLKAQRRVSERELESLVKDGDDGDARVQTLLRHLRDLDMQLDENKSVFQAKIRSILTIKQQAHYELFEKKFEANLRQMIDELRKRKGERP
jgi:Spy/CpxP family protein refolding chaperone